MIGFQIPGSSPGLIDMIEVACAKADSGGGAFAFATASGVDLLRTGPTFAKFLRRSDFQLIVGLDAITDDRAVSTLAATVTANPRLDAKVFLNPHPTAAFHPKLIWFGEGQVKTVITGSGNLTKGGLKNNWEAYRVSHLAPPEAAAFDVDWVAWIATLGAALRPLDDAEALDQARRNRRIVRRWQKAANGNGAVALEALAEAAAELAPVGPAAMADRSILVTPWPNNARISQLNVTTDHFLTYFATPLNASRHITFIPVDVSGTSRLPQLIHAFYIQGSKNPRLGEFELARNLAIPAPPDRPIYLFDRLALNRYRYMLLMPADPGYNELWQFLGGQPPKKSALPRALITQVELRAIWPNAPLA